MWESSNYTTSELDAYWLFLLDILLTFFNALYSRVFLFSSSYDDESSPELSDYSNSSSICFNDNVFAEKFETYFISDFVKCLLSFFSLYSYTNLLLLFSLPISFSLFNKVFCLKEVRFVIFLAFSHYSNASILSFSSFFSLLKELVNNWSNTSGNSIFILSIFSKVSNSNSQFIRACTVNLLMISLLF